MPSRGSIKQVDKAQTGYALRTLAEHPDPKHQEAGEQIIGLLLEYKFVKKDFSREKERLALVENINQVCAAAGLEGIKGLNGYACLELVTHRSHVARQGLPKTFSDLLDAKEARTLIQSFLNRRDPHVPEQENRARTETCQVIARALRSQKNMAFDDEVAMRALSDDVQSLRTQLRPLVNTTGITETRQRALAAMLDSLDKFDAGSNRIDFARQFNDTRWALPEQLQLEASRLVGCVKGILPNAGIVEHRPSTHVSSPVALWDTVWLGMAKFKMKAICATYGKYLDLRIKACQKRLEGRGSDETASSATDSQPEMQQLRQQIAKYKREYNKYSYFRHGLAPYAKLDRKINKVGVEIASLPITEVKKKIELQKSLDLLKAERTRMTAADAADDAPSPEPRYSQDLANFVKSPPAVIDNALVFNTGHAGNLIVVPGQDGKPISVITDPMFDDAQSAYPAETQIPLMSDGVAQVPSVDFIFISHNHMDHVNPESLRLLIKKNPAVQVIVPGGCCEEFVEYGVDANRIISACQWGMTVPLDPSTTLCVTPAVHWSGSTRAKAGINDSGVISCVVTSTTSQEDVFYAGDTAELLPDLRQEVDKAFTENHRKVFLLPSGPNYPRQHMQSTHQSTAAQVHFGLPDLADGAANQAATVPAVRIPDTDPIAFAQRAAQSGLTPERPDRTVLTHHDQIHFGADRFGETTYILCKQLMLLAEGLGTAELQHAAARDRDNAFIYRETAVLLEKMSRDASRRNLSWTGEHLRLAAADHLLSQVQAPLIGAGMAVELGDVRQLNLAALERGMAQAQHEFRNVGKPARQEAVDIGEMPSTFLASRA
jgi:L-ascorbate metabolism protein UlaG (beta-lactamase superfamily)